MSLIRSSLLLPRVASKQMRFFSSGADLVKVSVNDLGIATVSMNKAPVNSLNQTMLKSLLTAFDTLEKEKCKGMILTSESNKVFSAGLDIMEMYKPTLEKAQLFWTTLQDTWIKLYSTSFPTVAVINGHSPAGGCLLSLSCEYRIMLPNFTIGLNETQLGIIAPRWFQDCMRNVIGERQAELALIGGRMYSTAEAIKIGLVDEVSNSKADAIAKAEEFIQGQMGLPFMARKIVKQSFRQETLTRLLKNKEADVKLFTDFIFQPKVQQSLEMYLQALKKK